MKKNRKTMFLIDLLIILCGVLLDRITKLWAIDRLKGQPAIELISGVLEFRYLENRGAAFGILQNQKSFFLIMTTVVVLALFYVLYRMPFQKAYLGYHIGASLLLAGALGNYWDRIFYEYVVDFIYFVLIDFPIFNVADIFVTVTCFGGAVLVLLSKSDEADFSFLFPKKKKVTEE